MQSVAWRVRRAEVLRRVRPIAANPGCLYVTPTQEPTMTSTAKTTLKLSALLASVAITVTLFAALADSFAATTSSELAVVELPSVTIVGKRQPDSATMLAADQNSTPSCNAKL